MYYVTTAVPWKINKTPQTLRNMPDEGSDHHCDFCHWSSKAKENYSAQVNRHVKQKAELPDEGRGSHPATSSPRFKRFLESRCCFKQSKSETEKKERREASIAKYVAKRREQLAIEKVQRREATEREFKENLQSAFERLRYWYPILK